MGGGKRNYRAMRAKHRQWRKEKSSEPKEKKKEVSKEDKQRLIELWEKMKKKKE